MTRPIPPTATRFFLGAGRALRLGSAMVAPLLVAFACGGAPRPPAKEPPQPKLAGGSKRTSALQGLVFTLAEGQPSALGAPPAKLAAGTALSAAGRDALLARLPRTTTAPGPKATFAFRARSLPPPRTGKTATTPFPPPNELSVAQVPPSGALKVLRATPQKGVDIAPRLSVTFNQPMVALSSHAETLATGVPVKIHPEVQGQWRWIGTKTLLFEPIKRFPMATVFQVEVPQGTRSATGGALEKAHRFSFETPPLRLVGYSPSGGSQPRQPLIILRFDQRIDLGTIAKHVRLDGAQIPLRLASERDLKQDDSTRATLKGALEATWIALRPERPLPAGTQFTVVLPAGAPSTEGPRRTDKDQSFSFRTFDPLRLERHSCAHYRCTPGGAMWMHFNNKLLETSVDPKQIKVDPPLADQEVVVNGRTISILGRTLGQRTYQVTLPPSITDLHDQQLGQVGLVSFRFGKASQRLSSPGTLFRVLDPAAKGELSVYSVNHSSLDVELYRVDPSQWSAFTAWQSSGGLHKEDPVDPPGTRVEKRVVQVKGESDALSETRIDLKGALGTAGGNLVVLVKQRPFPRKRWGRQYVAAWVHVSELALDLLYDKRAALALVTRLADGKPVANAKVRFLGGPEVKTDAEGIAHLPLLPKGSAVAMASKASARTMTPYSVYPWQRSGWSASSADDVQVRWFVFDDRKLYKPKERVQLKGWVRAVDFGPPGGVQLVHGAAKISYRVFGPRDNEVAKGSAETNGLGGFDFGFKLPDSVNLGHARVDLVLEGGRRGGRHSHAFRIAEFRRPKFEVSCSASAGPHLIGGDALYTASANYFSGGPLATTEVRWHVQASKGSFRPPGHDRYTFVGWRPSWWQGSRASHATSESFTGRTGAKGQHQLAIRFESVDPPQPMVVRASATVQDVNRQSFSADTQLLVHPAAAYLGLATKGYFVERGTPLVVDALLSDLDGKLLPRRAIRIEAVPLAYRWRPGKGWQQEEKEPQSCERSSKGDGPVQCSFTTKQGGTYLIRGYASDAKGRKTLTEMTRWVAGGRGPTARSVTQEQVRLIADKTSYRPGQTAQILVQSPFADAEGVLTVQRGGILRTQRFRTEGFSKTLQVKLSESDMPGLHVEVDLVGATWRLDNQGQALKKLSRRPAFARGATTLAVPALSRKLAVKVLPQHPKATPGQQTAIAIQVNDAQGQPVAGAELALVVVDEAVLALTGYRIPDPLGTFYPPRWGGVSAHHLRRWVSLADAARLERKRQREASPSADNAPLRLAKRRSGGFAGLKGALSPPAAAAPSPVKMEEKSKSMANRERPKGAGAPIAMRKDFRPLALFSPALRTDAGGHTSVPFTLPDSLTRYRIFAIAVSGGKYYGKDEATIVSRMPLMVRPSPPRFLNFGDRAEVAVVLHNQSATAQTVSVAARTDNLRLLRDGFEVQVGAEERVEVRFPVEANAVGRARMAFAATAGKYADAATVSFPVWTPAITEAFATYGTTDRAAVQQPVKMPRGVVPQFGGLDLTTSSTALSALTDAVLYLVAYPFECSEQLSSRVLTIAALKDVLSAFQAPGMPAPEKLIGAMQRDVAKLAAMQNYDGGFPTWARGRPSWPFGSVHVGHALARLKQKGFAVEPQLLSRHLRYLRRIESHIPGYYSRWTRQSIIAYALYVRRQLGERDTARAQRLLAQLLDEKEPNLDAIAWLYPVVAGQKAAQAELKRIRLLLNNRITETAGSAHFVSRYAEGAHLVLHSNRRLDGLLLEGLIEDQPRLDLIPKLVRGLLAHRKRGRWGSTQENAWVLLGLDRYFRQYEKVRPNFIARAWLGGRFAGEHAFRGRTTERHQIAIPMAILATGDLVKDLVLSKQGPGRLYYRIGMRYAPADLKPPAASHGFTVTRRYEAVDDPQDVRRDADGSWRVKAGRRVRVRLTMVAPTRRYHVALVDPLAAGLEAQNPELRGAEPTAGNVGTERLGGRYGFRSGSRRLGWRHGWYHRWGSPWYEHQNLRDERAEAFTSLLWGGVYDYSYIARATTYGSFVVPPPKAEEMYHPETFGRGAGDRLIVY